MIQAFEPRSPVKRFSAVQSDISHIRIFLGHIISVIMADSGDHSQIASGESTESAMFERSVELSASRTCTYRHELTSLSPGTLTHATARDLSVPHLFPIKLVMNYREAWDRCYFYYADEKERAVQWNHLLQLIDAGGQEDMYEYRQLAAQFNPMH